MYMFKLLWYAYVWYDDGYGYDDLYSCSHGYVRVFCTIVMVIMIMILIFLCMAFMEIMQILTIFVWLFFYGNYDEK